MKLGFDALLDEIVKLEKEIKNKFPEQRGKVLLANAKTEVNYISDKKDVFKWNVDYKNELERIL